MKPDKLIFDDNCSTCCFINRGLQHLNLKELQFIAVSEYRPAKNLNINKSALRTSLHYITADGQIKKNAEACLYVLANVKYLAWIKFLYIWPIKYLFDLAYFLLKCIKKLIK